MLDLEDLKRVKTIITHTNIDHPCADGRASALILRDALPGARVRFVAYNTREHVELQPEPGMLFCDFTPHVERKDGAITAESWERVRAFVEAGAIVLDHHAGAREIVEAFGARGVYADEPGVSGAVLALVHVWDQIAGSDRAARFFLDAFARDIGIRDTWQRADPGWDRACAASAALAFYPWPVLASASWPEIAKLLDVGPHVLAADRERAEQLHAGGFIYGLTGGILSRPISILLVEAKSRDVSNVADLARDADLVVGWSYRAEPGEGPRMHLSFRSRGAIDCSEIARFYGGGGHKGAAGCSIAVDHNASPHQQTRDMIGLYLDSTLPD